MTDAERLAIEHACSRLIALYANYNDEGLWDDVAALYSEDGIMARPSAPDDHIVGREAILASFKARPARASRHLCTNIVIDVVSPVEASGKSAVALFLPDKAPKLGWFHDRFVKRDDEWLFSQRLGSLTF